MKRNIINASIRIALSLFALVGAWVIGGFIGSRIITHAQLINKMETLPDKIGSSIGVLIVAFLLTKYIFKSFRQVVLCFIVVEIFALIVVLSVTQLWSFTWFDLKFNIEWLYTMTWNVAIAYAIGVAIGYRMKKC
ncbi:MAG: hypothetical protein NTV01_20710 [Bacteroidia bacterium]|nr:hypothetical protein [Bacteroidia bacterium]